MIKLQDIQLDTGLFNLLSLKYLGAHYRHLLNDTTVYF